METGKLKRVFVFDGQEHDDPGEHLPPAEVLDYYSTTNSKLLNANISEPEIAADKIIYKFENVAGSKG